MEPIVWPDFWSMSHTVEDWLCDPIIPRHRAISIFSRPKVGKSLLALYLAAGLATGRPTFARDRASPISVVYLDLEMTYDDLYERLSEMGYGPDDDLSHLHYYLLPELPPMDTPEGGKAALSLVRLHHPDLLIVDTAGRVLVGEENKADTMRAFYLNAGLPLKSSGVTVLRLDHAGKDSTRGQRGTSAKADDVDLVWELSKQRNGGLALRATHRRQAWIPEAVHLERRVSPLRFETRQERWLPEATSIAARLDELGLPLDVSANQALDALRSRGEGHRKATVLDALRARREARTVSGTAVPNETGTGIGNCSAEAFGNHGGNHSEPSSAGLTEPGSP